MNRSECPASRAPNHALLRRALISAGLAVVATCALGNAQSRNTEHTLKLDDPSSRPAATFEDVAWMVGSWRGEAFGGSVEEDWQAASGAAMTGVFKLTRGGQASMYEFMMIVEVDDSLELRLKHFDADFTAWEEKSDFVSFPLVQLTEDAAYFEGLSYRKVDDDRLVVHVSIGDEKEETEIELVRRRSVRRTTGSSPYAGMESRPIKALSEQQIVAYRSGEGMGFAMVAELNGYPGPKHVLELEDRLHLTPSQLAATREAFDRMHAAAVALGNRIVAAEEELDGLLAEQEISSVALGEATAEISRLEGQLRAVHLRAHLEMVDILTAGQRNAYMNLRGYAEGSMPAGHHPGMHHPDGN